MNIHEGTSQNDPKEMPIPAVQAPSTIQNTRAVYTHIPNEWLWCVCIPTVISI